MSRIERFTMALLFLNLTACSGSGGTASDGSVSSNWPAVPSGFGRPWNCSNPGGSCNAHNSCVIEATCGEDSLCHPIKWQDCDDGLECTEDTCPQSGVCDNKPRDGYCALPIRVQGGTDTGTPQIVLRCFQKGESSPDDACQVCDPERSQIQWSPATGGVCDDGNACTRDDFCVNGECKGNDYSQQCSDGYSCTDDICDGLGGCAHKVKAGQCLINGTCYKDKDNDPSGSCRMCDVASSQTAWSPVPNTCEVYGKCHKAGEKHPQNCAECDPATNPNGWTVKGDSCLIDNICKSSGAQDSIQCSTCDPSQNKYGWTPIAGHCSIGGSCYATGAQHPDGCAECDPSLSATSWTVKGDSCLIANGCKSPGDTDTFNCSACDPSHNKYGWTPLTGLCQIDGACQSSGVALSGGCATCDPAKSNTAWTPTGTGCVIDQQCWTSGATHAAGCGSCDPSKSTSSWTVTGGCLIGGSCFATGAKEAGGCGVCDPTKNTSSWTLAAGCKTALLWSKGFANTSYRDHFKVALDSNGNSYITGTLEDTTNFGGSTLTASSGGDVFLASFSPSGLHRWSTSFGATGNNASTAGFGVTVDPDGNVYITGEFRGSIDLGGGVLTSKGRSDIFLASYTPLGQHRWSKSFGGAYDETGRSVTTDGSGNVYLAGELVSADFGGGTLSSTSNSSDIFLASFSSSGQHRWSNSYGSTEPDSDDVADAVATDASGNVYLTGHFGWDYDSIDFGGGALTNHGSSDIFLASFSSSGQHRWSKVFGDVDSDSASGVAVDSAGDVFITGYFAKSIDFGGGVLTAKGYDDIFLASFTSGGAYRWSAGFGDQYFDTGADVATDSSGNVYFTGGFEGSVDFGGGALSVGDSASFVASFDPAGGYRWSRGYPDSAGYGVVVDGTAGLYVIGYYSNAVDFGNGPLPSSGYYSYDTFLIKLRP